MVKPKAFRVGAKPSDEMGMIAAAVIVDSSDTFAQNPPQL
jgi:hypothetical protein